MKHIIAMMLALPLTVSSVAAEICLERNVFLDLMRTQERRVVGAGLVSPTIEMEVYVHSNGRWIIVTHEKSGTGFRSCVQGFGQNYTPAPPPEKPA